MAKLQIDLSGRAGLAPRFWGDIDRTVATPELRILGKEGQMADGIYNPFRRYGYMSPSNATFTDVTLDNASVGVLSSSIYDSVNDDFYFMDRQECQIYKGDGLDDVALTRVNGHGATGTPVSMDLEIYQINGSRKIFYVYEKSGNLEVGVSNLPFDNTTSSPNWLTNAAAAGTATGSANATGSFTVAITNDAFMRVADNGFAYIFQDNNIHKIDGSTNGGASGTLSANVVQFPAYFQIIDAVDYRGNMYIALHQNTQAVLSAGVSVSTNSTPCGIVIWDRQTSSVNMKDYIPLEGIKQIRKIYVSPQGDLRLIVVNSENITEIRKYNGSTFVAIEEAGYLAHPQFHDSVTTIGGLTVWLGYNGNIYAHGKISPFDTEGIFKIGNLPESIQTFGITTGAVLFGGGSTDSYSGNTKPYKTGLYVTYNNASSSKLIKAWDIYGTGADGITTPLQEQGDVYTLVKFLPAMSSVNFIDIYNFPIGTTGTSTCGTVKIYFNQSSTAWATKTITRDQAARGYITIDVDKQFINSIQLEIEFKNDVFPGTSDYAPSFAVVDYTPTETRG